MKRAALICSIMGKYKHVPTSAADFIRRKHDEMGVGPRARANQQENEEQQALPTSGREN